MTRISAAIARISDLQVIALNDLKLPFIDVGKLIPKVPSIKLPAPFNMLKIPAEPPMHEFTAEPFAHETVRSHFFKSACAEMGWTLFGLAKAAGYSVYQPYKYGYMDVNASVFGIVYNMVGGKSNKKKEGVAAEKK